MVGGGACGVPAASPLWGSRSGSLMRGIPRLLAAGLRSGSPAQHMFPARSWNRSLLGLVVFSRARERPGTSVSGRKAPGNRLKGVTNDAPYKGVGNLPRPCCHWDVQRLVPAREPAQVVARREAAGASGAGARPPDFRRRFGGATARPRGTSSDPKRTIQGIRLHRRWPSSARFSAPNHCARGVHGIGTLGRNGHCGPFTLVERWISGSTER